MEEMRGSMKRKKSRGGGRSPEPLMRVEDRTLRIRVPEELDHHSAALICAQADELVKTKDIREIVSLTLAKQNMIIPLTAQAAPFAIKMWSPTALLLPTLPVLLPPPLPPILLWKKRKPLP